jgi:hypothetical protein
MMMMFFFVCVRGAARAAAAADVTPTWGGPALFNSEGPWDAW